MSGDTRGKDAVARFYDTAYGEGHEVKLRGTLLDRLFVRLRRFEVHRTAAVYDLLEPGERLLDLGCGDGTLLARARANKFGEVHGLDVADVLVTRAAQTCTAALGTLDGVTIRRADLNEPLPLPDHHFDAVTAIAVVEHLFDPYFTVDEIRRVLCPGGQLIVEVPNIAWLPRRLDLMLGRLPLTGDEEGWDGGHLHYFTFAAVRDLLTSRGFGIEYSGSTGIFPRLRNLRPSLLGANVLVKARME